MPTENEKQITAVMQVEIALDKYERWIEGNHKAEKFDLSDLQNAIKQALTTERQQLIDAYGSDRTPCSEQDAIDYFEQTFNPQ